MGLAPPEMTDGIDTECGIQHRKRTSDAGEQKATDPAHPSVDQQPCNEWKRQSGQHYGYIVAGLPHHDRILSQPQRILFVGIAVRDKQPSAMTMPESSLRIVWITRLIALRVMPKMVRSPFQHGILKRPSSGDEQQHLDAVGTIKASMCGEPVVPDRDAKPREDVKGNEQCPIKSRIAIDVAEGRYDDHGAGCDGGKKNPGPDGRASSGDGNRSLGENSHAGD